MENPDHAGRPPATAPFQTKFANHLPIGRSQSLTNGASAAAAGGAKTKSSARPLLPRFRPHSHPRRGLSLWRLRPPDQSPHLSARAWRIAVPARALRVGSITCAIAQRSAASRRASPVRTTPVGYAKGGALRATRLGLLCSVRRPPASPVAAKNQSAAPACAASGYPGSRSPTRSARANRSHSRGPMRGAPAAKRAPSETPSGRACGLRVGLPIKRRQPHRVMGRAASRRAR